MVVQLSKQSVFAADFTKIIELKKPCCTCQEPITDLLLNTPTLRIKRGTVFFLSQLIQMTGNQPGVKFVIHCYDSCTITCTSSLFQAFRSWERGRRRKEMCRQKKTARWCRSSLLSSFLPAKDFSPGLRQLFYVARYHLGKVKLERVGQRSSPTSVCDLRGGPRGIAGLLVCPFASVALHCSFAC